MLLRQNVVALTGVGHGTQVIPAGTTLCNLREYMQRLCKMPVADIVLRRLQSHIALGTGAAASGTGGSGGGIRERIRGGTGNRLPTGGDL